MASSTSFAAADRYAKALFSLAESANSTEAVTKDVEQIAELLRTQPDVKRLIDIPLLSRAQKQTAILAIADRAKVTPLARQFLERLASNGRLNLLPAVAQGLRRQWQEKQNITHAHVTIAAALTAEQIASLSQKLEAVTGKKVMLETSIDKTLLGGVTVRLGSVLMDASLAHHLTQLKQNLKQAIAA